MFYHLKWNFIFKRTPDHRYSKSSFCLEVLGHASVLSEQSNLASIAARISLPWRQLNETINWFFMPPEVFKSRADHPPARKVLLGFFHPSCDCSPLPPSKTRIPDDLGLYSRYFCATGKALKSHKRWSPCQISSALLFPMHFIPKL